MPPKRNQQNQKRKDPFQQTTLDHPRKKARISSSLEGYLPQLPGASIDQSTTKVEKATGDSVHKVSGERHYLGGDIEDGQLYGAIGQSARLHHQSKMPRIPLPEPPTIYARRTAKVGVGATLKAVEPLQTRGESVPEQDRHDWLLHAPRPKLDIGSLVPFSLSEDEKRTWWRSSMIQNPMEKKKKKTGKEAKKDSGRTG